MKVKYSTSLVTLIYIHILFIHILFIHLSPMSVKAVNGNEKHKEDDNEASQLYQISQENKKILDEQVKAHLLKVLGLKEVPKKPQNKAYVPHAMLEEYRKIRESVRDVIPDDRDFYGKINIDDLEQSHEDFWGAVYNKYGGYDIEVDMGLENDADEQSKRLHYKADATPIACLVPQGEPEDVPPRLEHALPPHASSIRNQKSYISVHLRFKLSQEIFTQPMKATDIKRADLYLSREKIYKCELNECDRKPVPLSTRGDNKKQTSDFNGDAIKNSQGDSDSNFTNYKLRNRPRYQRIYILHIYGYDEHNEPISRIHDTRKIDTTESTPLSFEVSGIIKRWLIDPSKNYGIIVRVTNDDDEFEKLVMMQQQQQSEIQKRSVTETISNIHHQKTTNASSQNNIFYPKKIVEVEEHVRLKREFRSYGESDESWLKKQPSILIYSNSQDTTRRRHVKRDYLAHENENMQADSPDNTGDYITSTSTSNSYNPIQPLKSSSQMNSFDGTQTNDNQPSQQQMISKRNLVSFPPPSSTSTDSTIITNGNRSRFPLSISNEHPVSRRDSRYDSRHASSQSQYNRNNASGGARSNLNGSNNQNSKFRGKGKPGSRAAEKCSVRTLSINFDEVGWSNWIIAPTAYFANYCAGDCSFPVNSQQNTTNHAIIQSIFFSVGRVVPRSCCAPTRLGNMAILYQLDGSVQMKHYDDMIVEACGCL